MCFFLNEICWIKLYYKYSCTCKYTESAIAFEINLVMTNTVHALTGLMEKEHFLYSGTKYYICTHSDNKVFFSKGSL